MTCSHFRALMDGLIDGEVETSVSDEMQRHLRECKDCAEEHAWALRLKQSFAGMTVPDPGAEYWRETTEIILARTVGADHSQPLEVDIKQDKRAFVRSLVSVAASLLVLFTAMLLGAGRNDSPTLFNQPSTLIVERSVERDSLPTQTRVFAPSEDQTRLLRGTLLLASPGAPGLAATMARTGVGTGPSSGE